MLHEPSRVTTLGHDDDDGLLGRSSHQTIHYKKPDGSPNVVETCPMVAPQLNGETVSGQHDWFVRRDGSVFSVG